MSSEHPLRMASITNWKRWVVGSSLRYLTTVGRSVVTLTVGPR